jgi:hypothetical protein
MLFAHNAIARAAAVTNDMSHVAPSTKTAPHARGSDAERAVSTTDAMRLTMTSTHYQTAR